MAANKSRGILVLIILIVLIVGGVVWFVFDQRSVSDIRHVILISIDTCRADHLSCYGYEKKVTPNLDALAGKGYLFSRTTTAIPLTLPAHTSMLTGTIPPHHGRHENKDPYFDPSHITLAQLLKKKGFVTGAFIGSQILNGSFGLDRGFDIYQDEFADPDDSERRGEEVNLGALDWLEKQKGNQVFLFLHYYDPHDDYDPPEPFASRFKESPYAGEIAYTDYCIGKVMDKLKKLGMYESSLVIVTGDHGELLGEHGESSHMFFIYEGAMKVPMIYKLPGVRGLHKIDDIAGIIDIVPTVCELLEIEPPSPIQGESLAGYFTDDPPENDDRYLYCESLYPTKYDGNTLLGMVGKRWKYIQTTRPELYDLQKDPKETTNLAKVDIHRGRILQDRLKQILEQTVRRETGQKGKQLDAKALAHLNSLGYVGSSSVKEDFSFDQSKEDPKDIIGFHEEFRKVNALLGKDEKADIGALGDKLVKIRPGFFGSYKLLLGLAMKQRDFESAIRFGKMALELKPDNFNAHNVVGLAYFQSKRDDDAAIHFERALEIAAGDQTDLQDELLQIHIQLGLLRFRQKNYGKAITQFKEVLKRDAKQPEIMNVYAQALLSTTDPGLKDASKALKLASQACELNGSKNPVYMGTLAVAYATAGNLNEALKVSERALILAKATGNKALIGRQQRQYDLIKRELLKSK